MFYQFIDEKTIKKAAKPLNIDGKDIFTTNEKIHNEHGFFRLICDDYPQDGNCYRPKYILDGNLIYRQWEKVEIELTEIEINVNGEGEEG